MAAGLKSGTKIRVRDGVMMPELPDFSISGWTGKVTDVSKRGGGVKYFIEWDDETLAAMSDEYREKCEEQQLYHPMACLEEEQIEPAD